MMDLGGKLRAARSAPEEELWGLIREGHPEIISNALLNPLLTEEMAVFMAKGKTASAETLGALSGDIRFKASHKLKFAICKNPKSPQKVSISLLKFLRLFDLAEISKNRHIPPNVRQKAILTITEKIPTMPPGLRAALARRAGAEVVVGLMERSEENVLSACLESPALTEGHVYGAVNKPRARPILVRAVAEHPKWSLRYAVRLALIRNFHTPMIRVVSFVGSLKTDDLRVLYSDPRVPKATRPFIYRELSERNEAVKPPPDETYDLRGDEDSAFSPEDSGPEWEGK